MTVYLRYVGHGSIIGVPARDLTRKEAQKFGEELLIQSGLYRKPRSARLKSKRPPQRYEDKGPSGPVDYKE